MWSGKCGRGKGLCPLSFGVALGITCGLTFFIWSIFAMYYGWTPMMVPPPPGPVPTWPEAFMHGFIGLIKGFIFGFVLALLYDLITCCCRCKCCRGESCGCGCKDCSTTGCKCGCNCCSTMNKDKSVNRDTTPINKM